jgi:hypothetical protein
VQGERDLATLADPSMEENPVNSSAIQYTKNTAFTG